MLHVEAAGLRNGSGSPASVAADVADAPDAADPAGGRVGPGPAIAGGEGGAVSAETPGASISARDVSAETRNLPVDVGPRPLSRLADGTRLSAETARRLACDASVVVVARASNTSGSRGDVRVLDVGRRTRTIPPALRRALDVRDGGCRYPGCGSRFADAHHIVHWADGGETRLENLVLLCLRHHRAVHEGRARVCRGADDSVAFFRRDGRVLYDAPPRRVAPSGEPEAAIRDGAGDGLPRPHDGLPPSHDGLPPSQDGFPPRGQNGAPRDGPVREDELRLDLPSYRTGAARWAHDRDVPLGIEVRALEALERAAGWR